MGEGKQSVESKTSYEITDTYTLAEKIEHLVPEIDEDIRDLLKRGFAILENTDGPAEAVLTMSRLLESQDGLLGRIASAAGHQIKSGNLIGQIQEISQIGINIEELIPKADKDIQEILQEGFAILENVEGPLEIILAKSALFELQDQSELLERIKNVAEKQLKSGELKRIIEECSQSNQKKKAPKLIPPHINSDMHWIRVYANNARHNKKDISRSEAMIAIEMALNIVRWFYCEYKHSPKKLTDIYTCLIVQKPEVDPPEKSSQEPNPGRIQIEEFLKVSFAQQKSKKAIADAVKVLVESEKKGEKTGLWKQKLQEALQDQSRYPEESMKDIAHVLWDANTGLLWHIANDAGYELKQGNPQTQIKVLQEKGLIDEIRAKCLLDIHFLVNLVNLEENNVTEALLYTLHLLEWYYCLYPYVSILPETYVI